VKVFISWSGEPSKQIAAALRDWLPLVIQACKKKTYMSDRDNEAGICLTPGNLESRWIYYEAGALSKLVGQARVVPLLHDLGTTDIGLPLSRFQMTPLHEDGIRELVRSMNSAVEVDDQLDESELTKVFNGMWPNLKEQLDQLPAGPEARKRTDRELIEEILELSRSNTGSSRATRATTRPLLLSESDVGGASKRILDWFAHSPDNPPYVILMDTKESKIPDGLKVRLRQIAGPDGYVTQNPTSVTIRSPRVASDDFTQEERSFLDNTREFLAALGMELKYTGTSDDNEL
jgi:hypothetical protein